MTERYTIERAERGTRPRMTREDRRQYSGVARHPLARKWLLQRFSKSYGRTLRERFPWSPMRAGLDEPTHSPLATRHGFPKRQPVPWKSVLLQGLRLTGSTQLIGNGVFGPG